MMKPDGSFSGNVEDVKSFLQGIKAGGGGDFPEDVAGALLKVR